MELDRVNRLVLRKHHLCEGSRCDDIIRITDDLCGLHATGAATPCLSLFARTNSFRKDHLQKALYEKKLLEKYAACATPSISSPWT